MMRSIAMILGTILAILFLIQLFRGQKYEELVEGLEEKEFPLKIASISKLMTFLLVKEKIAEGKFKLEDKVKVSVTASSEEGSSLDLKAGEEISVKDLLDGLMIVSGNDASMFSLQNAISSSVRVGCTKNIRLVVKPTSTISVLNRLV